MKIEMHAHTSPVSPCGMLTPVQVVKIYEELGYDAIVVTNHYSEYSMPLLGDTFNEKIGNFIADYRACVKAARTIKVFLGAEVAIRGPYSRAEFLLYGIDEDFLYDSPLLIEQTQSRLYSLCRQCGAVMIQAHPFRTEFNMVPQDCGLMDGIEVNCHPAHLRQEEKVRDFASAHGLLVTAGSDFHGDGMPSAGIITDEPVDDVKELAEVLRLKKYRYFYDKNKIVELP